MKKCFLLLITTIHCVVTTNAQNVAINNSRTLPHISAMLDVRSTKKGLLIPRVSLLSETDVATIATPQTSLLICNTNTGLPDGQGYYFWDGTKWSKFATLSNLGKGWNVAGNSGTNTTTDFIGTTDNKALLFKTNNILSGKIDPVTNNVFLSNSWCNYHRYQ